MSFSSLPEELVDQICSSSNCMGPYPTNPDSTTLTSLCLVSRYALLPARRALYRYPLWSIKSRVFRWSRAERLLDTLTANENAFGQLVHGISSVTDHLQALINDDDGYQGSRVDNVMELYFDILDACPQLQHVDFCFSTRKELNELLQALHLFPPSTSGQSLRNVIFSPLFYPANSDGESDLDHPDDDLGLSSVFSGLSKTSISSLDSVVFKNMTWVRRTSRPDTPQFPFPIKRLQIDTTYETLAMCRPLFPRARPALEGFKFSGMPPLDDHGIRALPNLVGSNLRNLDLYFHALDFRVPGEMFPLSEYALPSKAPPLPLQVFRCFPHLTSLSLSYTHGPSLRLLETLAVFSPLLRRIAFVWSFWIYDSNPRSAVPDEHQVLSTLIKFRYLTDIFLGTLPTTRGDRYENLVAALKSKGPAARFGCCVEDESD